MIQAAVITLLTPEAVVLVTYMIKEERPVERPLNEVQGSLFQLNITVNVLTYTVRPFNFRPTLQPHHTVSF